MQNDSIILLDSNVLIYAQNRLAKLHPQAQAVVNQAINGDIRACIAFQNSMEMVAVVSDPKRFAHPLTQKQLTHSLEILMNTNYFQVIFPNKKTAEIILDWSKKGILRYGQALYDVVLVATMLSNGVHRILTANPKDFIGFPDVEVVELK